MGRRSWWNRVPVAMLANHLANHLCCHANAGRTGAACWAALLRCSWLGECTWLVCALLLGRARPPPLPSPTAPPSHTQRWWVGFTSAGPDTCEREGATWTGPSSGYLNRRLSKGGGGA